MRASRDNQIHGCALAVVGLVVFSCRPVPQDPDEPTAQPITANLVTAERRSTGGALVLMDESGLRVSDLTKEQDELVVDRSPAWSSDGRWVAFVSNRGRGAIEKTGLWVIAPTSGAAPRALTAGREIDRDPAWGPSGHTLYFASSRSGSFQLWKVAVDVDADDMPVATEAPVQLTSVEGHAFAPGVSPDGRTVAFMVVDPESGASRLWTVPAAGGDAAKLTDGPTDVTPVFDPTGEWIYFARIEKGRDDSDIVKVAARGGRATVVIDEPIADQTGPRLSRDGRYLFATAVYKSKDSHRPVLSSIVAADLKDRPPRFRVLHDPAFVESRVGVAVAPQLDGTLIGKNPEYLDGLKAALEQHVEHADGVAP